LFNRTKAAIAKGQQVKAAVQAAPASAKAAAGEIARKTGSRLVNGSNHCKQSESRRHQAAVPGNIDKPSVVMVGGVKYQVLYCRCCEGIMKIMSTGRKN